MDMSPTGTASNSDTDADKMLPENVLTIETEQDGDRPRHSVQSKKCQGLRHCCHKCWKPVRTKYNPLPKPSTRWQQFRYGLMCAPHGILANYIVFLFLFGVTFAVLVSLMGKSALPGGLFFSLMVMFYACFVGGYLASLIKLPPLLGMLIVGFVLRNVPGIINTGAVTAAIQQNFTNITVNMTGQVTEEGDGTWSTWSGSLRQIALMVVLIRAGLGLDLKALKKLSLVLVRLAFCPCLAECLVEGIAAHFLLGFPWEWAFMLGFVLSAISPAVVVSALLGLSDQGYGHNKGVPTLVIAGASGDVVMAVTGFGVMLGITFSEGSLALSIVKGPLEALLGVVYGIIVGVFIWYIPDQNNKNLVFLRSLSLFGGGLVAIFGSTYAGVSGAGPLGCLSLAFVAAQRWRTQSRPENKNAVGEVSQILWTILEPLLFGLIGAEIDISTIDLNTLGLGLATLVIGLTVRMAVAFLTVFKSGLNFKEMMFIAIAWAPKATVQAAMGGIALDRARQKGWDEGKELGKTMLTTAVLAILVTAPLGAAAITIAGPRLLSKIAPGSQRIRDEKKHLEDGNLLDHTSAI